MKIMQIVYTAFIWNKKMILKKLKYKKEYKQKNLQNFQKKCKNQDSKIGK